jgi:hypothetical protein
LRWVIIKGFMNDNGFCGRRGGHGEERGREVEVKGREEAMSRSVMVG